MKILLRISDWVAATTTEICTTGLLRHILQISSIRMFHVSLYTFCEIPIIFQKETSCKQESEKKTDVKPVMYSSECNKNHIRSQRHSFGKGSTLALAPSIFGATHFGRWVVTHSSADFNFHDHRPAICSRQHPFWYLKMSKYSGTRTELSDHPASSSLLTSIGPHGENTFNSKSLLCEGKYHQAFFSITFSFVNCTLTETYVKLEILSSYTIPQTSTY